MIYVISVFVIIVFVTLSGVALYIWENWQRKQKIEKLFAGRQELSELNFYEKYFQNRAIPLFVVSIVRKKLEEEFNADLSRLQPDDKFSDLSFSWVDNWVGGEETAWEIEDELNIKFHDDELEIVSTIDDFINLVWQKVQERENAE